MHLSVSGKRTVSAREASIPGYIDTLDGFRTIATILVMLFHYWQQSWVGYSWSFFIGSRYWNINLEPWIISGSLGVEILFVLSGFCLYYPYALAPERKFNAALYAYKRFVRILPAYLLCFLTGALLYLPTTPWAEMRSYQMGMTEWWYHFIGGLFFGQNATVRMYTNPFNGVLWSLPVEMQFYLFFPLILRAFRKKPTLTTICAFVVAESWRFYLRSINDANMNILMNQLPAMIDVFVGGMYAAYLTGILRRALDEDRRKALATVFSALTVLLLLWFSMDQRLMWRSRYDMGTSVAQMHLRKYNVAAISAALMCSAFAGKGVRKLLGNRFTRFFASISYELYMWHMLIGLKFKEWHIPPYTIPVGGEHPMDDVSWRLPYMLISIAVSLLAATLLTYCFEQPVSRYLLKHTPEGIKSRGSSLHAEITVAAIGIAIYILLQIVLAKIM